MVTSTQIHTGVPACPGEQHRTSRDTLATSQPRPITTAVIKMFPGTAQQQGVKAKLVTNEHWFLIHSWASEAHGKHRSLPINLKKSNKIRNRVDLVHFSV